MLTKGAIGNLVNKYRAVLKKCGLLNIFGSLALAGALTVGAAGMAGAAAPDDPITITSTSSYTGGNSAWANEITIGNNASVTVSGNNQNWTHPSYPNETWRSGSMIWAENSLNMSGGIVTLGYYGGMGVSGDVGESSKDHQLNITGGEVKLNSEDSAQVAYLRASATADYSSVLNLGGGTGTATVSVANAKYGFIAAETLNMNKGGSITVAKGGYLTLAGSLLFTDATNAVINPASSAGLTISAGKNGLLPNLNLNDAAIVVGDNANVEAGNLNFSNSATTISGLHGSDVSSIFTFGAVSTAGPTVVLENGGAIGNNGQIVIDSGNFTVAGVGTFASRGEYTEKWRKASMISSETGITVKGGSIALGDHGLLSVSDHASTAAVLSLNGGTIDMDGSAADKAAVIRLTEADQSGSTVAAKFYLSGGSLNVGDGKYGVIAVADNNFDVQGGTLNVARNGTLELIAKLDRTAGAALVSTAAGKGLTVTGTSLDVSGGAVNVKDGLTLNKDGKVNVSGGTLVVDGATTWTPVSGGTSGKLTISSSGSVTLQKSSILNADYGLAAQITDKANQLGLSGGTLLLTSADDYTVAQLTDARTALGVASNGTALGFLGGKLVDNAGEAETLVVDAKTSGTVTSATVVKAGSETIGKADSNAVFANNSMNVETGVHASVTVEAALSSKDINLQTAAGTAPLSLSVGSGGNVTVVGDKPGQSLVTGQNGVEGAKQDVAVAVSSNGTFNMGLEGNSQNQGGLVDELNVVDGTANVNGNGAGTSDYTINSLSMTDPSAQVNATNTTLSIGEWDAQDGTLYVDPAYVKIDGLAGDLSSALLVGDGSVVNIGGMSGADLRTALAEAGMSVGPNLTLGDGQSALALTSPVTVSGAGKIVVDARVDASGKIDSAAVNHQAYFGADSVLVVDASKLGADAAITGTAGGSVDNSAVIAPDAHLQVVNATKGEVTLLDGFAAGIASDELGGTDFGWVKNSVANPDRMLTSTAAVDPAAGSVTLTNTVNKASDVLPGLDGELNPAMADVWDNAKNDVNAEARGVRFLSRAARADYIADARQAAVTIESAARMALVGAVPQMTMAASNAAGNAVTQRTGLAQPGGNAIQSMAPDGSMQTGASAGDAARTGFAMWIMPLYQSSNGFGMKAGNFDMDFSGGLGGVAIGADYTFDNAIRAGITFNIGGGYATGSGDLNETTNNMNFWGIGAYAGWAQNNFGVTADVNYTSTYNKLEQDLPASMQMGKLKSDVTAYAISAGLRGEYKIETSALDIIPHVGVRYMSLNTDEYDVKSGGTLLKGDAINQSIWTFPIGVAFSKQIETGNGWHFKPSLDLAVIPAAGDIDARSDVRFTGTGTKAELDTQTMDYVSYMGQAGLEFGNETTSLGVNYNIQLGAKSTAHGVFGTFRYEF